MVTLQHEPKVGENAVGNGAQQVDRRFDDEFARLTHEMMMLSLGQVVDGAAVPEMHVQGDAELFECVECPVHGGEVNVGMFGLHFVHDVLGCHVLGRGQQRPHNRTTRRRDAPAVLPPKRNDFVQPEIDIVRRMSTHSYEEYLAGSSEMALLQPECN